MQTQQTARPMTHIASLGGEQVELNSDTYGEVVSNLVARHPNAGIPLIVAKAAVEQAVASAPRLAVVPGNFFANVTDTTVPGVQLVDDGINQSGRFRAMNDEATAREAGFAPKPPIYSIGTRVVQLGVDNARASQVEHDAKPSARDAALHLVQVVRNEKRYDYRPMRHAEMKMNAQGRLLFEAGNGAEVELPLEHHAFTGLVTRAIPAKGAASYLTDCPAEIRAANWNRWRVERETEDQTHVLRTRLGHDGQRRAFAAVSERYVAYDANRVGEALALAFPADAKGVVDYDGSRYRVEGLWHTDVAAEEFVAGEIFKAGVIVRGADDGSGSIRVQSVIWRNLCLNLIILDKSVGVDIKIRHTGKVQVMARQFRDAFGQALTSVQGFRKAWSSAMLESGMALVSRSNGTTGDDLTSLPLEAVLPGLFNGILQRELVPVQGRKQDIVPKLLDMHRQDEAANAYGISRASIVNAFTRYAHQVEQDPFRADLIREGAGSLLASSKRASLPDPIPYVALPML